MIWVNQVLTDFARKTLDGLMRINRYPDFFNLYGIFQAEQKHNQKAKECFQKAIELNKNYLLPRLNLQYIYLLSGDKSGMDSTIPLKMILCSRPLVETQLLAAEIFLLEDRIKEARQIFKKMEKISNHYPELFLLLGLTCFLSGEKKEGEKHLRNAIGSSVFIKERAALFLQGDLNKEKIRNLLMDLVQRAFVMPLLTQMAGFCASRANNVLASRFLEMARESNPDCPSYLNLSADFTYSRGNQKEAEEYYLLANMRDPRCAHAAIKLSFFYGEKGEIEKSLSILKKSVQVNPGYADLHDYLGEVYMAKRKFALAQKHFNKALAFNPRYSKAWMSLVELYERKKKWDETFHACLQVISISRQAPQYLIRILKEFFPSTSFSRDQTLEEAIQQFRAANTNSGPGIDLLLKAMATK
jgi:tetratricopeptide (TPR) repeat protein